LERPTVVAHPPKPMLGLGEAKPVGRIVRANGRWHRERLRGEFLAAALGVDFGI